MVTHTAEVPYKCSFCGKAHANKYHMPIHSAANTGDRPFLCSLCDTYFTDNDDLQNHTLTHTQEKHFCVTFVIKKF